MPAAQSPSAGAATAPGQATHKISLRSVQDLDDEVLHLLRIAYEQNA